MDPDIKNEWIERLRSGTIPQTINRLGRADGSRCCLGVLCDIAVEHNVITVTTEHRDLPLYDDEDSVLPFRVMRWARLDTIDEGRNGHIEAVDEPLSSMNDTGMTFDQIADVIEYFL